MRQSSHGGEQSDKIAPAEAEQEEVSMTLIGIRVDMWLLVVLYTDPNSCVSAWTGSGL